MSNGNVEKEAKISVVVPVYNVEKYISQCVESILNQTLQDIEIILVDDGSKDSSGSILDKYALSDNRVSVIHKKNGGVSAARNDGIDRASAPYIYIMDSDDYLEKDALESLYNIAIESGADIVMGDHYTFTEDNKHTPHHFFSKEFTTDDPRIIADIQKMILHFNFSPFKTEGDSALGIAPPWTRLVKTSLIKDNSILFDPYVKGIFDDGLFALEEMEYCKSIAYTKKYIYRYRLIGSSLVHRYNPNRETINDRIIERLMAFRTKFNKDEDFLNAVYCRITMLFVNLLDTYYLHPQFKAGLLEKQRLIKKTLKKESYQNAFKKAEISRLTKTQAMVAKLVRRNAVDLIPLMFKIRELARGVKGK